MASRTHGGVLVTGGAGFIGRALSRKGAAGASRWVAVDNMSLRTHSSSDRPAGLATQAELVVADICDSDAWDAVLEGWSPSVVIHLAAETDTGLSLDFPTRFTKTNVDGTAELLEALDRNNAVPERLVLASSRAVYGEGVWKSLQTGDPVFQGVRPRTQLDRREWDFPDAQPAAATAGVTRETPTNIYGVTKFAQEGLMNSWAAARGSSMTNLRLQNVYGPGQSLINPYTGILALFVRTAAEGKEIHVFEDGAMLRDFVHIDDVAEAFMAAIATDPHPESAHTVDIGTGDPHPVLEIATLIASEFGAPVPRVTGEFRHGDVRHAWCTIDAAKAELHWQPRVGWRAGVQSYAQWYAQKERTS